jgi:tRNA pseudouridine55 synthase
MTSGRWDGLLLVDKPAGPTSHDVVAAVRRATGQARIGHAGTLDPPATGLLPLVLGRATRLVGYLPDHPKRYVGTLRLGSRTTTDDLCGEVLERFDGDPPSPERVAAIAAGLEGRSQQVPPTVSAKKIGGRRLHVLSRAGVAVAPAPVWIEVERFEVVPTADAWTFEFAVSVSAGTYVRALARDLGATLGCGGAIASLRRTAIGPFLPDARLRFGSDFAPSPEVLARALVPLDAVPLRIPTVRIEDPRAVERFLHGHRVPHAGSAELRSACRVLAPDGALLGIGDCEGGTARPRVVLPQFPAL